MSWRDQLRKASYRGVEFLFAETEGDFGRRTATHQYPLRDKPYVEDLGRKAREFTIEAFVLATAANGFNYMPGRDALIAAIEQSGPGVLVHPYHGEMRVSVTSSKVRETTKEGGMARFTLTFTESGDAAFPNQSSGTAAIVNTRADAAAAAAAADLAKKLKTKGFADFITTAASDLCKGALDILDKLPKLGPVNSGVLADYVPGLADLRGSLTTLFSSPATLASSIMERVDQVRALSKRPLDGLTVQDIFRDQLGAFNRLRQIFGYGDDDPDPGTDTASRVQQGVNQQAIADLVQRSAAISYARAAAETDFPDFGSATDARGEIADRLDVLMERADDDETYSALADLRAAMVKDINTRGANLARVVDVTPPGTMPALVLAHGIYGDATRDEEIIERNNIRHPGFTPGGRPLEVLSDG